MSKEIKNANNFKKELTKLEQIFELEQATNTEALYGIDDGVTYIYFTNKEDHEIKYSYEYNPVTNKIQKFNKSSFIDSRIEEDENGNMAYRVFNSRLFTKFPVYKVTPDTEIIKKSKDDISEDQITDFLNYLVIGCISSKYSIINTLSTLRLFADEEYKAYVVTDCSKSKERIKYIMFNTTPNINKYALVYKYIIIIPEGFEYYTLCKKDDIDYKEFDNYKIEEITDDNINKLTDEDMSEGPIDEDDINTNILSY